MTILASLLLMVATQQRGIVIQAEEPWLRDQAAMIAGTCRHTGRYMIAWHRQRAGPRVGVDITVDGRPASPSVDAQFEAIIGPLLLTDVKLTRCLGEDYRDGVEITVEAVSTRFNNDSMPPGTRFELVAFLNRSSDGRYTLEEHSRRRIAHPVE